MVNPHPLRPLQRRLENRGLFRGKLVFAVLISDFVRRIVEKTQIFFPSGEYNRYETILLMGTKKTNKLKNFLKLFFDKDLVHSFSTYNVE